MLGYPGQRVSAGGLIYDATVLTGLRELGVVVDELPVPWFGFGYARGLAGNLLTLPTLTDYDVVLQDEMVHPSMVWRNRRIRRAGIPVVALVHNLTWRQHDGLRRRLARGVERAYLRGVDGVIAVCASTQDDVVLTSGVGRPTVVAHAGRIEATGRPNEADVTARATAPGALRLISAGVVVPHKGVHRLLDLVAAMPAGRVTLDVVGRQAEAPAYVRALRARITAAGLDATVRLHDEVDRQRLSAMFANSHLFVLGSEREAYSLAALEALGAGLPCLLPDAGGSGELLGVEGRPGRTDGTPAGVAGLTLPVGDTEAWVRVVSEFAADRTHLARCALAALARHQAHGTWRETSQAVYEHLHAIVDGWSQPRF